jgi:FlaA1/EpsC-like NDP-sugar epimerase
MKTVLVVGATGNIGKESEAFRQRLLGRKPRTLRQFAQEHVSHWR